MKYIDQDQKDVQTAILIAAIGSPFLALIGLKIIDSGWPIFGMVFIGLCLVCVISLFVNVPDMLKERALIKAYKTQTTDFFISSLGNYEAWEDDDTVIERVAYALAMLKKAGNPHCITIYASMFRDACVFVYELDREADVAKQFKIFREGLTVRETREQYCIWWETFKAKKQQEALVNARKDDASDNWVNEKWFHQKNSTL